MSFQQQLAVSIASGALSAVVVTGLGGAGLWWLGRRADLRRQEYEIRTTLVERAARTAQEMYVACQHAYRADLASHEQNPNRREMRDRVFRALDDAYLRFSADAASLETLFGARFGVSDGPANSRSPQSDPHAFWQWHQIRDLLTVYYFNLAGYFQPAELKASPTGREVLEHNSVDCDGKFHSGLNFVEILKGPEEKHQAKLTEMLGSIRDTYNKALPRLAQTIMVQPLNGRSSRSERKTHSQQREQ